MTMARELFVGSQLWPCSYITEGVEGTLRHIVDWSGANAILLVTANRGESTYHRAQLWDADHNHVVRPHQVVGGYYSTPHPEFYEGTALKPVKSPEEGLADIDALQVTIEAARPLGLKVYANLFEALYTNEPGGLYANMAQALAVDALGRPAMQGCYNNPNYRGFLLGMVEDHVRSYEIDGIYIEFEGYGMQSPSFFVTLPQHGLPICFCNHCMEAAKKLGWDGERARIGYLKLKELMDERPEGAEPLADGEAVEFLRLILHYPEIVAWESLWMKTRQRMLLEIYGTAKTIAPGKEVGWNINSPVQSMPVARAAFDYRKAPDFADWVKPNIHNAFAGRMFDQTVDRLNSALLPMVSRESIYNMLLAIFGYAPPLPADEVARRRFGSNSRFGPQFVAHETARVVSHLQGKVPMYAGLDVEPPAESSAPGRGMEASVRAAIDAGAQGIIMGQFYHDWPRESLEAVGRAVRNA